jgi:hypothetical protein
MFTKMWEYIIKNNEYTTFSFGKFRVSTIKPYDKVNIAQRCCLIDDFY